MSWLILLIKCETRYSGVTLQALDLILCSINVDSTLKQGWIIFLCRMEFAGQISCCESQDTWQQWYMSVEIGNKSLASGLWSHALALMTDWTRHNNDGVSRLTWQNDIQQDWLAFLPTEVMTNRVREPMHSVANNMRSKQRHGWSRLWRILLDD